MEKKVHEVVPRGAEPEDLDIHHVGYPGQGMPVRGMTRCECPYDAACGDTLLHTTVPVHIRIVVKVDKTAAPHLPEGESGQEHEGKGDEGQKVFRGKSKLLGGKSRKTLNW